MAKKSKIARNNQREVIVARYAAKRLELKKALVDPNSTDEAREAARVGLQKLPRNASPVRLRNRDAIDGRPWPPVEVRHLARPLPRHGPPWGTPRCDQVQLVSTAVLQRPGPLRRPGPFAFAARLSRALTLSADEGE